MAEDKNIELITIVPDYPHELLLHLSKLVAGKKDVLKNKEQLLSDFKERYLGEIREYELLNIAYDSNVVNDFITNNSKSSWNKRVCVEKSFRILNKTLSEKEAVILVESLMFVLDWKFTMDIERKVKVADRDKADFHKKTELSKGNEYAVRETFSKQNVEEDKSDSDNVSDNNNYTNSQIKSGLDVELKPEVTAEKVIESSEINKTEEKTRRENKKEPEQNFKDNITAELEETEKIIKPIEIVKAEQAKFYNKMNMQEKRTLKKAVKGDALSQCEMGDYYAESGTEHTDYKEAVKWYYSSADNGYERALFEIGKICDQFLSEYGGKKEALKIYTDMAERGFPSAQCILGMKYWFGDGVDVDINKAILWMQKAADQQHETAICNLGDIYLSINEDEKARRWYRIGSSQGIDYCRRRLKSI